MIVPDVNLPVYSVDSSSPFHREARGWWDRLLSSTETVGLCYPALLGFVRITTSRRVFDSPLTVAAALERVQSWLDQPHAHLLLPTSRHWPILVELLGPVPGNLTTDAHLAAHAIEHAGVLCSNDVDFQRFPGLRWRNPLDSG